MLKRPRLKKSSAPVAKNAAPDVVVRKEAGNSTRPKNTPDVPNKKNPHDTTADKKKDRHGLNDRQRRFCERYLIHLNGSRAAVEAGYSKKGARVTGSQLLANANVERFIARQQKRLSERTAISAERVLHELASVAFAEIDLSELKAGDKLTALDKLARHLNLFTDRVEVDTRSTVLNLHVTEQDLADARRLVEEFNSTPRLIEGKVEADTGKAE